MAAWTSCSTSSRGTGSGLRRRIARIVDMMSSNGASSPKASSAMRATYRQPQVHRRRYQRGAMTLLGGCRRGDDIELGVSTMTALHATTPRVRIPFYWWRHEASQTRPAAREPGYLVCDTAYIPSGTADMWRTARR